MGELDDKLKRMLAQRGVMTGAQWVKRHEEQEHLRQSGAFEIETQVPGEVVAEGDEGYGFYRVQTDFALETEHGGIALGAALEAAAEHVALAACDDGLREWDPATAVFIDTETTGLAGGTGTVAFLVGVGYFEGGVFRLEQCFMRDFDDEEPMLRHLDGLFRRAETVVSFNGKTFDLPLLRTRFLFSRLPFRLDAACHFDLVHAVRRIWKLRLSDCSLGNVEREVMGIRRHGDVSGAEIPQIWFDYLRTRDARRLPPVFYHHRMDILSLVSLTALLSRQLDVPHGEGFEYAEDRLSVMRLHFRQKRFEDAVAHARKLAESETDGLVRRRMLEMWALACKRLQDWRQMEEVFDLMRREYPSEVLPRLELAKHYEHRARNLARALEVCREGLALPAVGDAVWACVEFERRIERLERKLRGKE